VIRRTESVPYANEIERTPVWTREQEIEAGQRLIAARASGDPAKLRTITSEFVTRNLRSVYARARAYRWCGIAHEDLVQEGILGLLRAIERFEPQRGLRFGTFSQYWISAFIRRAVDDGAQTIRTPVHVQDATRALFAANARVHSATGRDATSNELREMTGLSQSAIDRVSDARELRTTRSLDVPAYEDGVAEVERTPGQLPSPEDLVLAMERAREARRLLGTLPAREAEVVRDRMGDEELTLQDVGDAFGVSRERSRQLETRALNSLRERVNRRGYTKRSLAQL
jgi:RNA polymerase primary sigma factor